MELAHLQRYTRPANFADFGEVNRREYFVAYGQHRDSDTLTRSNFRSILRELGGESETVLVIQDSHWAVGWVEAIYIHESDEPRLTIADGILNRLKGYPVVDESDWSELQYTEACDYWRLMSLPERVRTCQRFHVSVFSARHADSLPDDPQGDLIDYLTDGN